jgi:VWFA-related protein
MSADLRSPVAVALILIVSCLSIAQESTSKRTDPDVRQQGLVITVNVGITDAKGLPANDVKAENIRLFEDGVEQQIVDFQCGFPITHVGLLFDNSGSFRPILNTLLRSSNELADILLLNDREVFIIRFVSREKIELVQDWTSDRRKVLETLDDLYVEGGKTAVLDALYISAEKIDERMQETSKAVPAIVLISDVEDMNSYYSRKETIEKLKASKLRVFTVSFAENAPNERKRALALGENLAFETGGVTHVLPRRFKQEDINRAFEKIGQELNAQCVLQYSPNDQNRDGKPRMLRVEVVESESGEKRQVYVRDSVIVPKN